MKVSSGTINKCDLRIMDCGLSRYSNILQLQQQLRDQRLNNEIVNTVIIVEHFDVITLGARKNANKLLVSRQEINNRKIDIVNIRRGGGTTAHNPGQIVFYPLINLKETGLGISEYIRLLEQIGIELLDKLSVKSKRKKGYPGLWVDGKKIASIGVRVSRFITYHGMAINIQNDLSIFELFVPCGLDAVEMTSAYKETKVKHSMTDAKKELSGILVEHLSSEDAVEYKTYG
jgi:lipoate-protein ligase B